MGGTWVDYNLMSTLPGLFVVGEANFSDHGANRLGASALMQGLGDGYFVLPYTIGHYFVSSKQPKPSAGHAEFKKAEADIKAFTSRLLSIKGKRTPTSLHRELGKLLWEKCGMARNEAGLKEALKRIPELRAEFWKNVNVTGEGGGLNQSLEYAGRVADFMEFAELLCLDALERFLHSEDAALPPLIRAGLAHVQFETIHPFLDGNGRLGRLLITLILCEAGVLREPILYLSLFLKSRRDDYYRLLQEVRQAGTWETWMEFFLTGVAETAEQAAATARDLIAMFDAHRQEIAGLGRAAPSALRVHELMQASPIVTIQTVSAKLAVSFPTASTALENLAKIGVVRETTGRQRGRIYAYSDYLALLERGTDPLPA